MKNNTHYFRIVQRVRWRVLSYYAFNCVSCRNNRCNRIYLLPDIFNPLPLPYTYFLGYIHHRYKIDSKHNEMYNHEKWHWYFLQYVSPQWSIVIVDAYRLFQGKRGQTTLEDQAPKLWTSDIDKNSFWTLSNTEDLLCRVRERDDLTIDYYIFEISSCTSVISYNKVRPTLRLMVTYRRLCYLSFFRCRLFIAILLRYAKHLNILKISATELKNN